MYKCLEQSALELENILNKYSELYPEYNVFLCNFVRSELENPYSYYLRKEDTKLLFRTLCNEFLAENGLPHPEHSAFIHELVDGLNCQNDYEYLELVYIYRQYLVEWMLDKLQLYK